MTKTKTMQKVLIAVLLSALVAVCAILVPARVVANAADESMTVKDAIAIIKDVAGENPTKTDLLTDAYISDTTNGYAEAIYMLYTSGTEGLTDAEIDLQRKVSDAFKDAMELVKYNSKFTKEYIDTTLRYSELADVDAALAQENVHPQWAFIKQVASDFRKLKDAKAELDNIKGRIDEAIEAIETIQLYDNDCQAMKDFIGADAHDKYFVLDSIESLDNALEKLDLIYQNYTLAEVIAQGEDVAAYLTVNMINYLDAVDGFDGERDILLTRISDVEEAIDSALAMYKFGIQNLSIDTIDDISETEAQTGKKFNWLTLYAEPAEEAILFDDATLSVVSYLTTAKEAYYLLPYNSGASWDGDNNPYNDLRSEVSNYDKISGLGTYEEDMEAGINYINGLIATLNQAIDDIGTAPNAVEYTDACRDNIFAAWKLFYDLPSDVIGAADPGIYVSNYAKLVAITEKYLYWQGLVDEMILKVDALNSDMEGGVVSPYIAYELALREKKNTEEILDKYASGELDPDPDNEARLKEELKGINAKLAEIEATYKKGAFQEAFAPALAVNNQITSDPDITAGSNPYFSCVSQADNMFLVLRATQITNMAQSVKEALASICKDLPTAYQYEEVTSYYNMYNICDAWRIQANMLADKVDARILKLYNKNDVEEYLGVAPVDPETFELIRPIDPAYDFVRDIGKIGDPFYGDTISTYQEYQIRLNEIAHSEVDSEGNVVYVGYNYLTLLELEVLKYGNLYQLMKAEFEQILQDAGPWKDAVDAIVEIVCPTDYAASGLSIELTPTTLAAVALAESEYNTLVANYPAIEGVLSTNDDYADTYTNYWIVINRRTELIATVTTLVQDIFLNLSNDPCDGENDLFADFELYNSDFLDNQAAFAFTFEGILEEYQLLFRNSTRLYFQTEFADSYDKFIANYVHYMHTSIEANVMLIDREFVCSDDYWYIMNAAMYYDDVSDNLANIVKDAANVPAFGIGDEWVGGDTLDEIVLNETNAATVRASILAQLNNEDRYYSDDYVYIVDKLAGARLDKRIVEEVLDPYNNPLNPLYGSIDAVKAKEIYNIYNNFKSEDDKFNDAQRAEVTRYYNRKDQVWDPSETILIIDNTFKAIYERYIYIWHIEDAILKLYVNVVEDGDYTNDVVISYSVIEGLIGAMNEPTKQLLSEKSKEQLIAVEEVFGALENYDANHKVAELSMTDLKEAIDYLAGNVYTKEQIDFVANLIGLSLDALAQQDDDNYDALTQLINDVKAALQKNLDDMQKAFAIAAKELEKAISDAKAALETADNTNKLALEKAIADAKTALETADSTNKAAFENAIASTKAALDKAIADAKAELQTKIDAKTEKTEFESAINDLNAKIGDLNKRCDSLRLALIIAGIALAVAAAIGIVLGAKRK